MVVDDREGPDLPQSNRKVGLGAAYRDDKGQGPNAGDGARASSGVKAAVGGPPGRKHGGDLLGIAGRQRKRCGRGKRRQG